MRFIALLVIPQAIVCTVSACFDIVCDKKNHDLRTVLLASMDSETLKGPSAK